MSPRPMRFRRVAGMPGYPLFRPAGAGARAGPVVVLTVEEFEAIRLKDNEGLDQRDAAKKMKISQPTFQRIYESARKKIADALVNGKAIRIEGGRFMLARGGGSMQGRGRMGGGFAAGPSGECVCTKCGHRTAHERGVPCYQMKCPKCGAPMTRG